MSFDEQLEKKNTDNDQLTQIVVSLNDIDSSRLVKFVTKFLFTDDFKSKLEVLHGTSILRSHLNLLYTSLMCLW